MALTRELSATGQLAAAQANALRWAQAAEANDQLVASHRESLRTAREQGKSDADGGLRSYRQAIDSAAGSRAHAMDMAAMWAAVATALRV